MKNTQNSSAPLRCVLTFMKPYGGYIALSILSALFIVGAQLLIPVFSGNAIDGMLGAGLLDTSVVLFAILCIAASMLVGALAQMLLSRINNRIVYSVSRDIRNRVSRKLQKLPLSYIDRHKTGDIVSRVVSDVDAFSDGLLMGFTQLFSGALTIVAIVVIMLFLNPVIALAVIVLTPLSILVARFLGKRTHRFFTEQAAVRGEATALINELVEGGRTARVFGYEKESLSQFDKVNGRLGKATQNAVFFSSLVNPSTRLLNNIVYAVVALICSFYAIMTDSLSVGALSVFLSYASQYAKPFNDISGVITELQNAVACASRVFALLEEAEEDEGGVLVPPKTAGEVRFCDVSFSYTPDRPLISHITLDVKAGERIAIVGPTGCGKTTLINLLMRFYDVNEGAVLLDGVDIRQMSRHTLRAHYGMVLQDTWLKTGTVRENIAYGKPGATDEEIIAAAKAAHAHSFIRRLPEGYDTKILENGSNLSAGQRQLLCIARAMLSLPPMLILDEATSSIDTRTEKKIQNAFATMMKGRTSFIVAHRLSTIKEADKILVMKDGTVIEQGSHDELLARDGFYAMLYLSQFSAQ